MKKKRSALVIGNWKMNPTTQSAAKRLFASVKKGVARIDTRPVVIAAPSVYLSELQRDRRGSKKVLLGAQDAYWEKDGAHTGETSVSMLRDIGVTYVLVGHSEKRARGMSDEEVNTLTAAVLKSGLIPVICIGERKRDTHGDYLSFVEKQLRAALSGIPKTKLAKVIIAYEPIWAIGTGDNATPADVHEMKLFIQKILTKIYSRNEAHKMRILYGGSVHARNAAELLVDGTADGFLIGGASLKADEFIEIIKIAVHHGG